MKQVYDKLSIRCSKLTTRAYSTSFSIGIACLHNSLRDPIYSIYGFVRLADEIVDSFHDFDKPGLLARLREETHRAIAERISLNPILNSFQFVVHRFQIESTVIDQFLNSMEMDLLQKHHDPRSYEQYVLGSAEVVGLMCLRVFCDGNEELYGRLKFYAMRLGAAFQKINFLRDLKADYNDLGRSYFPGVDLERFDPQSKKTIEADIAADFSEGYKGITQLPRHARFGVYVAYVYYLALFRKIRNTPPDQVLQTRISIPGRQKAGLLAYSFVKDRFNLI